MELIKKQMVECRMLTEQDFCAAHQHPFLVCSAPSVRSIGGAKQQTPTIDRLVVGDDDPSKPSPGPGDWYLVAELVPHDSKSNKVSIGCAETCDVRLEEDSVSRLHAWIAFARHGTYVQDAGSSAGTAVNGKVLTEHDLVRLSPWDRISLGNVDFIFLPPREFYVFVRNLSQR